MTVSRDPNLIETICGWANESGYDLRLLVGKETGNYIIVRMVRDKGHLRPRSMLFHVGPEGVRMSKNLRRKGRLVKLDEKTRRRMMQWLVQGL